MIDEKNEFIGVATHDLKNPLSVLTLAIDLFRMKTSGERIIQRLSQCSTK
jgi:signal transduction histidine kinase